MSNLSVNTSALASVRAFLNSSTTTGASSSLATTTSKKTRTKQQQSDDGDDDDDYEMPVVRPPRLGLGATWDDKHKPGGGNLGIAATGTRRLSASLKVEASHRASNQNDSDMEPGNDGDDSEDDMEESRARVTSKEHIGSSARKKRKRREEREKEKKQKTNNDAEDEDEDENQNQNDVEEVNKTLTMTNAHTLFNNNKNSEERHPFQKYESTERNQERHPFQSEFNGIKKKKKKTRSRQKNFKKDKRPKHLLPAHLTEETLHMGRVKRPEQQE